MINITLLNKLPIKSQLTFLIVLCKRNYNNYYNFSINENYGDYKFLLTIEDYAIRYIIFNEFNVDILNDYQEELSKISPHMDDFGTVEATYALDTCSLYYDLISFLQGKEDRNNILVRAAELPLNTIYVKIEDTYKGDIEDDVIMNHKLMKAEIEFQDRIIKILSNIKTEDELFNLLSSLDKII